jgi:negative regulator of flagellin synthesis FlgM
MKIHSNKPPESQGPHGSDQDVQIPAAGDQKGRADLEDISGRSREIAGIMRAINQLPEVRDAKVRKIKMSVDAGTYIVDPRKVAEKMMKYL